MVHKNVFCCVVMKYIDLDIGVIFYDCRNKVKVIRNGIHYCGIHDPVMKEERKAKIQKKKFDIREKKRLLWNNSQCLNMLFS